MPPLSRLQSWTQECILTAGTLAEHLAQHLPTRILASRTLSPAERLDIYRRMYEARLIGALKVDYPVLLHALGAETFDELARLYIAAHPSRSYTLNRLGDELPDFIGQVDGLPNAEFHAELARFELLETQVFDEVETPMRPWPQPEVLAQARFAPIAALRIAKCRYPLDRYVGAFRSGKPLRRPRPAPRMLAIYRREFQLQHLEIRAREQALFEQLKEGASVEDAIAAGGKLRANTIRQAFQVWFSAGIFQPIA